MARRYAADTAVPMDRSISEMVERVARAITSSANRNPDRIWPEAMGETNVPEWRFSVDEAEAAIAAMREPTQAMYEAGMRERNLNGSGPRGLPLCFTAMIDAALSPAQEP